MRLGGAGAGRPSAPDRRRRHSCGDDYQEKSMRLNNVQPSECVLEIVTPRTNAARLSPAEHLFSALVLQAGATDGGPVSLEISADSGRRRFLARTSVSSEQRRVAGQLGAAYPQAVLRPF